MMTKKSLLLATFLSSFYLSPLSANTEAPPEPVQFEVEAPEKAVTDDAFKDVDEKALQFVRKKKANLRRKGRLNEVFITSGSALVNAKTRQPDWGDARVIAYQQAQMKAREQLLKQLYAEVTSKTIRENFRTTKLPEFTPDELQNQNTLDSILEKIAALTNATLDEKLKEKGIDPDQYQKAPLEKRKLMLKKALTKTVTRESKGQLSGALIAKTFETTDRNGNTAISVVLMTSVKMKNTLATLRSSKGNIRPNKNKTGVNIEQFLAENKNNLMYQYGLKLIHDEQGYPVLLSFAQAGNSCNPVDYDSCIDNRGFALIDAENDAYSFIAEAYNLNGQLKSETTKGEEKTKEARVTATPDGEDRVETVVNRILRETRELSTMTSQVKNLTGVEEAMRWTKKHPVSGREINGVVLAWHPVHERAIRDFKKGKVSRTINRTSHHTRAENVGSEGSSMELLDDNDF